MESMLLVLSFINRRTYADTIKECSVNPNTVMSCRTVADYFSFCREVCIAAVEEHHGGKKIGGVGHIVQVDESKLGKRKYERGRIVEGVWIFGMVDDDTNEIRLEICADNKRDEATLEMMIRNVEVGSVVVSDGWKGYVNLPKYGFTHFTVNHSENFVDPVSGLHTQKMEGYWRVLKSKLQKGGVRKCDLGFHLLEFMYFQNMKGLGRDPFHMFLGDIVKLYGV